VLILLVGNPEQQHRPDSKLGEAGDLAVEPIDRALRVTRHARDRPLGVEPVAHEQRVHELRRAERRLA
jgi:hypothetical protein